MADMHFVSKVVVNAGFSLAAVEMLAAEKPALLRRAYAAQPADRSGLWTEAEAISAGHIQAGQCHWVRAVPPALHHCCPARGSHCWLLRC